MGEQKGDEGKERVLHCAEQLCFGAIEKDLLQRVSVVEGWGCCGGDPFFQEEGFEEHECSPFKFVENFPC